MKKTAYTLFTESVTRLRNRVRTDPFIQAQVQSALLYVAFCALTLIVIGGYVDYEIRDIVERTVISPDTYPLEIALLDIENARASARILYIVLFAIGAFALMGLTLRPLKKAADFQKRFVANISHELRTPLTLARADTELALRKPDTLTLEKATTLLKRNIQDIDHISRIITFMLVLSDHEKQKSQEAFEQVSLTSLLQSVYKRLEEKAQVQGVHFTVHHTPEVQVFGNVTALEKMLLNIVKNALAHTCEGGSITLESAMERGKPVLTVRDTGTGIPPEALPHLFKPFYRARNSAEGGSGLGLPIVQAIVHMHKATIDIHSVLGEGTTVTIRFPKQG